MPRKKVVNAVPLGKLTETPHAYYKKRRNKILEVRIKPGTVVDRDVYVELWQQSLKLGGQRRVLLNGNNTNYRWRLDGIMSLVEAQNKPISLAILPQNALSEEARAFFVSLISDYMSVRVCKTEKEALAWLREQGRPKANG